MEVNLKKWMFYHLTEVTFYVNCVQLWYCSCSSENPCWVGGRRFWSTVSANPCWAGWRSLCWRRRSQTQQPLLSHRSSGSANPCWVGGESCSQAGLTVCEGSLSSYPLAAWARLRATGLLSQSAACWTLQWSHPLSRAERSVVEELVVLSAKTLDSPALNQQSRLTAWVIVFGTVLNC